ncbi:unnamed protein product [Pylaiella littoralis]
MTRTDDDEHYEGDARDCTLIVRGKKMSNSCLLGDHIMGMMRKCAGGTVGTMRTSSGRTAPILVLWHPRSREESRKAAAAAAVTAHHCPRQLSWSPVGGFTAAASTIPNLNGSQQEGGRSSRRRGPSRRSVQRRCKSAARFSGIIRGARRLGIQSLS